MGSRTFELVGGHPALDVVNTVHDWTALERRDYLADFTDALRFAEEAGLLTPAEVKRAAGTASARRELTRIRELRSRLERVFRAVTGGRRPGQDDLDALASDAADAAKAATLRAAEGALSRAIDVKQAGASALRWRIVEAAIALLTSPDLERLKDCPSCGWFYLDRTKNRSRRWCSMATCGSASKARAYYWRAKRAGKRRGDAAAGHPTR